MVLPRFRKDLCRLRHLAKRSTGGSQTIRTEAEEAAGESGGEEELTEQAGRSGMKWTGEKSV